MAEAAADIRLNELGKHRIFRINHLACSSKMCPDLERIKPIPLRDSLWNRPRNNGRIKIAYSDYVETETRYEKLLDAAEILWIRIGVR